MFAKKFLFFQFALLLSACSSNTLSSAKAQYGEDPNVLAWKKYGEAAIEHRVLAKFAGNWKYAGQLWDQENGTPQAFAGTTRNYLIMGGKFLKQDSVATADPYTGMGLIGYDRAINKYVSVWIDSISTGMIQAEGQFDDQENTLNETGKMPDPNSTGGSIPFRARWKFEEKNLITYQLFTKSQKTGKEFLSMQIKYRKTK